MSGENVYLLDRDENVGNNLWVLDLATGKELWTYAYNAPSKFMFAGSRTPPRPSSRHRRHRPVSSPTTSGPARSSGSPQPYLAFQDT